MQSPNTLPAQFFILAAAATERSGESISVDVVVKSNSGTLFAYGSEAS
jgi:hypothetical protein